MPLESLYAPVVSTSRQASLHISDWPAVTLQITAKVAYQDHVSRREYAWHVPPHQTALQRRSLGHPAGTGRCTGQEPAVRHDARCSARPGTWAGEMGRIATHLARESERLLADRLWIADVAEHNIRKRARLAFLQRLHVPLSWMRHASRVTRQPADASIYSRELGPRPAEAETAHNAPWR